MPQAKSYHDVLKLARVETGSRFLSQPGISFSDFKLIELRAFAVRVLGITWRDARNALDHDHRAGSQRRVAVRPPRAMDRAFAHSGLSGRRCGGRTKHARIFG